MRYDEETEERIESLTEDELRGVMDRIMRAAADRGYFGDDVAMSEIDRIIRNPRSEGRTKRLFSDELVLGKRRSGEIVKIRFMDVNNQDPEVKEGLEESYDVEVSYDAGAVIVKGQKEKVRRLIDREFDDLTLDEKKEEFPEAYR
tara:strand:- start:91 stop:525 length:435 start_codon:yes stop_codon:yes gene_type:complete